MSPEPPNVASMKSRTSRPRLTEIWRRALAWFQAEISRIPAAHSSPLEAEPAGEVLDAGASRARVQRDLPTEQVGRNTAEHEVGIGDRGLDAALAVADRSRVGAGRPGADLEGALAGDPGDGPAAGAHRHHVDHRDLGRVGPDRPLGGQRRLAAEHDAHVGRGATTVTGEDLVEPGPPADQGRAQRSGGRTGQDGGDGLVHDLGGREHAAVGLHDVERDGRIAPSR